MHIDGRWGGPRPRGGGKGGYSSRELARSSPSLPPSFPADSFLFSTHSFSFSHASPRVAALKSLTMKDGSPVGAHSADDLTERAGPPPL